MRCMLVAGMTDVVRRRWVDTSATRRRFPLPSSPAEPDITEDDAEMSNTCYTCDEPGATFRATKRRFECEECYHAS